MRSFTHAIMFDNVVGYRKAVAKAERACENRITGPLLLENYKVTRRIFDFFIMSVKRHYCGMAGQELDTALLGGQQRFWHQL